MRAFETFVLNYLVNSLWQVPLVFAGARVAARMVRRLGAAEHRVWCGGLLLGVALPACEANVRGFAVALWGELAGWFARGGATAGRVTVATGGGVAGGAVRVPSAWLSVAAVAYAAVTLYFGARLVWGLWQTSQLRRSAAGIGEAAEVRGAWMRYARRFGVEDAAIASVVDAVGPVTVGVFRRVLLLPAGWLGGVSDEDISAAIAHECAHMQRRDYGKNLLYRVLTLPVAYHPATWLMQARVVETREMVCDAMAAEAVAGRERYARSLLRLAENLLESRRGQNLYAIGIFDANDFERRVMKLTMKRMEVSGVRRALMAAACVTMGLGTGASAMMLRMHVATAAVVQEAGPSKAINVKAGVMAGNVVSKITPVYPVEAKEKNIQGAVVMDAVIGKDGKVEKLQVLSGPEELATSALDAVRQWIYKPYLLNGEPVDVETTITVNYSLAK